MSQLASGSIALMACTVTGSSLLKHENTLFGKKHLPKVILSDSPTGQKGEISGFRLGCAHCSVDRSRSSTLQMQRNTLSSASFSPIYFRNIITSETPQLDSMVLHMHDYPGTL